jgi:hypothetical protein
VLVCLLLALLFSVGPYSWAYNKGLIKNPFKHEGAKNTDDKKAHAH